MIFHNYAQRILSIAPNNIVGYWPLDEHSGTTVTDKSRQGNNGSYTGVTLNNAKGPDGRGIPFFDGTNDFGDIYSAALNSDFNGNEGAMMGWFKVQNSGVWTDGSTNRGIMFYLRLFPVVHGH